MPDTPDPPPHGRIASTAREVKGAFREFRAMTLEQAVTLMLAAITAAIVFGFGWVLFVTGPSTVAEINAANLRAAAERDERTREENRLRDEKFMTAFAAESERNRLTHNETTKTLMTVVLSLTKEIAKLQAQLTMNTEAMQKLQAEVNGLNQKIGPGAVFDLVQPCPMRTVPAIAPMPRLLTRG